ncbi:sugar phosphate isomerase/epimerase family protein [Methanobacterium paludis]|uniref:Xylose isomerase domain-containing protein TIM barrel n=1 Tax=Methanobacterium paludis (strain DSM 25820 / JCM 18151 / SWAN1) TaxID=868131 RepID=F6D6A6_METPW|nr:sugar phosphate isomerase/epimerase [Methanobacterium paludis]AEG18927.1 Xylose isomerase domain-containing protein TIM barrel [Methanobacterium paludis]
MKKVGVALYNNFQGSIESFFGFLDSLGVDYVEIGKEWIPPQKEINKINDLLDIYNLNSNLHVSYPYNLAETDERKWKRNILGVLGDLGVCYDLNIKNAVLHCGWIQSHDSSKEALNEGYERFAEAYNMISDFSKDFGVKIGLENQCSEGLNHYIFQDQTDAQKIMEFTDDKVSFVLDVGHLGRLGGSLNKMIETVGDNLIGIHVHDFDDFGRDHLPLGTGKLDLNALLRLVEDKDIFITLENRSVPHIKYSILHSSLAEICHPVH